MVKIERRIGPIGLMGLIGRIKDGVGGAVNFLLSEVVLPVS